MMFSLLIALALFSVAVAQYGYAVDINQAASKNNFDCLFQNHYRTVFIRAYKPDGKGGPDLNAVSNVNMAFSSSLGIEVYMTPNPTSGKAAATQVDEMVNALNKGGIAVKIIWLQVTSPINWNLNTATNNYFINSAIQRIRGRGIRPAIYTNHYDWQQITNGARGLGNDVMLWYWSVYSAGVAGESPADFNDFRPFGNWNTANIKQFGWAEPVCGFTCNRNIYGLHSKRYSTDALTAYTPYSSSNSTLMAEDITESEKKVDPAKAGMKKKIYAGAIGL